MKAELKIVVDSNVMISAALAIHSANLESPSARLFSLVAGGDLAAVACTQMLYELAEKLEEPRFALAPGFILGFVELYAHALEIVAIRGLDMGCRDDDDDKFIETAVNARADALVTRDRDLSDARIRYDLAKRRCDVLDVSDVLTAFGKRAQHP